MTACVVLTTGITVSIKPASSSVALVKRIELVYDGDTIAPGATELLSDPSPPKVGKVVLWMRHMMSHGVI